MSGVGTVGVSGQPRDIELLFLEYLHLVCTIFPSSLFALVLHCSYIKKTVSLVRLFWGVDKLLGNIYL